MSERARERAVGLLRTVPADADLALPGLTSRDLFLRTGYWPDVVRDEAWPARKEKYDRPTWHYVNHFWRDGKPLPDMGTLGELIDRLSAFEKIDSDPFELAWMLHLVGDIHQPLHSSARVTASEPEGDRGGNDFALDERGIVGESTCVLGLHPEARPPKTPQRKLFGLGRPYSARNHDAASARITRARSWCRRFRELVQSRRRAGDDARISAVPGTWRSTAAAVPRRSPKSPATGSSRSRAIGSPHS